MQNINSLILLQPITVIVISSVLMFYWYRKRHFSWKGLLFSLPAYVGAIALKIAVQTPTIDYVRAAGPIALGAYFGLQTAIFETGLAFLVAWIAIRYHELDKKDGEGYASGLAFWENAVLLGIADLFILGFMYISFSSNTTLFERLTANSPELFVSNIEMLSGVAIGIFERIGSIIAHFTCGYLCFMAVYHRKPRLFLLALPTMGIVDALMPFIGDSFSSEIIFQLGAFALSVTFLLIAWYATKGLRKQQQTEGNTDLQLKLKTPTANNDNLYARKSM
ncbi:MAG: YhfC family intramembrane metalloprotease [Nitrososphaerota archaeon]|jgi:uncharacterized membrane protein YhfC|nr:YhfC family intramembrane metalloprotease [Nitrososphaerota archaeon]